MFNPINYLTTLFRWTRVLDKLSSDQQNRQAALHRQGERVRKELRLSAVCTHAA
jgi:hypothetical protein